MLQNSLGADSEGRARGRRGNVRSFVPGTGVGAGRGAYINETDAVAGVVLGTLDMAFSVVECFRS